MLAFIKNHKLISGLIIANFLAIIIIIIVIMVHHAKTATIDILVAPRDATVTLNGKKYNNLEQHDILPGNYHVEIFMDNMQSKSYDIIMENNGFARIHDYLLDNDGGYDYYLSHPDDASTLANIISDNDQSAQKFIEKYQQKYSIIELLPIDYDAYTDDFAYYYQYTIDQDDREDCPKVVCLVIRDYTGGSEDLAKNKIKELGYDLNDYEINYKYVETYTSEINR